MTGTVVVLGATGYAGGLALDALLARGVRPVLAGTRAPVLQDMARERGGLEWRIADASHSESIEELVGPGDVLVTTVGPFNRLGRQVALAAARRGAHYVDSTGEVGFVRHLLDQVDPVARETGSTMLPAFGYDYVPGLLAATLAMEALPTATSVDIFYVVKGSLQGGRGLSQGTRRTMTEEFGGSTMVWQDHRIQERRIAGDVRHVEVRGHRQAAVLAGGTEVLFLPRHWQNLAEVRVHNGWFPRAAHMAKATSTLSAVLRHVPGTEQATRNLSQRFIGPAGGPDAALRSRVQGGAVAVARHGDQMHQVSLLGPNPYDITAALMAWAAGSLSQGQTLMPGVVDGVTAFGADTLRDACAAMGLDQA